MLGIVFDKKLILKRDIPIPVIKKGEALIRVMLSGICNTDLEIVKGYMGFRGILGHEFVGIVEKCSDKKWVGKRVAGEINISCEKCDYCAKGLKNHCPNRNVLGILNKNGAFAEYLSLPVKNLHILTSNIFDEEAVFIEPLAACFEVLEQVKIKKNDNVIVLGDGKLGLLMAQVIKNSGCKLYLIGKHNEKLLIAKKLGIKTINLNESLKMNYSLARPQDIKTKITWSSAVIPAKAGTQKTNWIPHQVRNDGNLEPKKADVIIVCTGSPEGLDLAINLTKPKGKIVLKSTYASNISLDLSPVVINEISIIGSRCGSFAKAIDALKRKKIKVRPLIYKTFSLKDGLNALEMAKDKKALKVLLKAEPQQL